MSQQRIEHGAESAVTGGADAAEGQGMSAPAAHPGSGRVGGGTTATDDLENPVGPDDRGSHVGAETKESSDSDADTEGERYLEETQAAADAAPGGPTDDGGAPSGEGVPARSDLDDGGPGDGPAIRAARDEGGFRHQ